MFDPSARLRDQVAIVTGAAGGIGFATVQALAAAGMRVALVDVQAERVQVAAASIDPQAPPLAIAIDVTDEAAVRSMAQTVLDTHGRIDLLVTCAGVLRGPGGVPCPVARLELEEWQFVVGVNLTGTFLTNRAVLPAMSAQRGGMIINVSSVSGRQGRAHDAPYCAAKFGVIGLSESLAEEVRSLGIRVQTVLPDAVDTPFWEQNGPIRPELALAPERVAELILFMAALPPDTQLIAPVIAPFRGRRRKSAVARGDSA